MEEGRFSQFYEHDIVILRITNHECIGIQEFTNIFFQFSRILEQHFFFSRVKKDLVFTFFNSHEFTKEEANSCFHERRWSPLT